MDSQKPVAIRLSGETILEEHCYFDNKDGKVMLYALPNSVTVCGLASPHRKIASHTNRRFSMAGKSPPDKVIDSDQVFESFSEITMFSGSTIPKKYGSNGAEQPTSLRHFNAVCLPLIWKPGAVKDRHGSIHLQGLRLISTEVMWTGPSLSANTRLPGWGWILRWITFQTKILIGYLRRSRR